MKTETKKKVLAYGMVGIMILVAVTVAASAPVSYTHLTLPTIA